MFFSIMIAIWFVVYLSKIKRSTMMTSNNTIKQITMKIIFPMLFLNSGFVQSAIQHLFYNYIIYGAHKTIIKLNIEEGVQVVVEMYVNKEENETQTIVYKIISWIFNFIYSALSWFITKKQEYNPEDKEDKEEPINVILVHGLNGSSESKYIIGSVNLFLRKKCRVFCLNARGVKGVLKTKNYTHFGNTEDLQHLTNHILNNYVGKILYVGFSQGANMCTRFVAKFKHDRIIGGVSVCNPFNFTKIHECVKKGGFVLKVSNWALLNGLKDHLKQVIKMEFKETNFWDLLQTMINKNIIKSKSVEAYLEDISSENYIHMIDKPFLFINADDDPLVPVEVIPKEKIFKNRNTGLITLQGGHLGFKSFFMTSSIDSIIDEFYNLVLVNK